MQALPEPIRVEERGDRQHKQVVHPRLDVPEYVVTRGAVTVADDDSDAHTDKENHYERCEWGPRARLPEHRCEQPRGNHEEDQDLDEIGRMAGGREGQ